NMFIGTPGPPGGSGNIGGTDRWVPGGNVYFPENGDTGDYGTVLGDPLTKPDPPVTDRGDNKTGRKRDN
ncbi:MAG TPA: hypothetical protein VJQ56_15230, partial [Blastocatellia bacterium]|nr:hypothetical protein [Blastocatellia bacterium]